MTPDQIHQDPNALRQEFERRLLEMPKIAIDTWKDTDLVCVFFGEKEIAHFHGDTILDLRLSAKIIRQERLPRDVSEQIHPKRSENSRWICVAFENHAEIDKLLHLVSLACEEAG